MNTLFSFLLQGASLNSTLAEDFKNMVYVPIEEANAAQYGLIAVGAALIVIAIVVAVIKKIRTVSICFKHIILFSGVPLVWTNKIPWAFPWSEK